MDNFIELLKKATQSIEPDYIQLPVAEKEDPIYRERVYCYELYHQLRKLWDAMSGYSLCGEIDKNGHPIIRDNELDKTKPDLLVHYPGDMDNNLVVIEVKAINANPKGIKKDLTTLTAYRRETANYKNAVYLIYGQENDKLKNIIETSIQLNKTDEKIDLSMIRLFHHKDAGSTAEEIKWNS